MRGCAGVKGEQKALMFSMPPTKAEVAAAMTGLLADETMGLAEQAARRGLAACAEGDMLRTQLAVLRRFLKRDPADTVAMRKRVAAAVQAGDRYPFESR